MITERHLSPLSKLFHAAGWSFEQLALIEIGDLATLLEQVRGRPSKSRIIPPIDLDLSPDVPRGFEIHRHIPGGKIDWNPKSFVLKRLPGQQDETTLVLATVIQKQYKTLPCYNASLLDWFWKNRDLIPAEWETEEGYAICFWGTTFVKSGLTYVRCLQWVNGKEKKTWKAIMVKVSGHAYFGQDRPALCPPEAVE